MNLLQKILQNKTVVEQYILDHGMQETVKKYGLDHLVQLKLLKNYEGTELYCDDNHIVDRVYNKDGKFLGEITPLMSPYYKKIGYFFGPCLNGNIVLSVKSKKNNIKTYAIFDKSGNKIVPYCKYFDFCFLPNGVALLGNNEKTNTKLITVHYDGTVKKQCFTYIVESFEDEEFDYEAYMKDGKESIKYYISAETLKNIMSSETEIGKIEKGIE